MTDYKNELRIDDVIFEVEDYVAGNIEGVDEIDRMAFTVFLRSQLEALLSQHSKKRELEAKLEQVLEVRRLISFRDDGTQISLYELDVCLEMDMKRLYANLPDDRTSKLTNGEGKE